MKRILTILLAVMMLFSFTGCDPDGRAKLAGYMGKMGQNVLGADTSDVDNVVKDTQLSVEDIIPKPVVGGESVSVTENVSLKAETNTEGKVVTKVTITGLDVAVEVEGEVEAVLPPMKSKDQTIKNIGNSIKNEEKKAELIKQMKEPVTDASVKEAAKGTAIIMKSALQQVSDQLPQGSEIPPAVKDSLKNVSESLEAISSNPDTVTQADVVTLQLVNSFVETVAKNSEAMKNGEVPQEVLTDANNLFTVSSALSEASKFNPNTLVGALVSGMGSETEPASRSLARDVAADGSPIPGFKLPAEAQTYINVAYKAVQSVLADSNFAETKNGLGFHKMSYENYANMVAGKVKLRFTDVNDTEFTVKPVYDSTNEYLNSREFNDFKTFAGLTQYAVATVFSEGDDYYKAFVEILSSGKYHGKEYMAPMDTSGWATNVRDLIMDFAAVNPWISAPTTEDVDVILPEGYEGLRNIDEQKFADLAMCLIGGRDIFDPAMPVNDGYRQYFRTALDTVNKMVVFTDLSSISSVIGDTDLNYVLMDLDKHLYVEPMLESK